MVLAEDMTLLASNTNLGINESDESDLSSRQPYVNDMHQG
jgi:hypothetical protein